MSVIQTPPRGLQDLLGSKNFGRNPSELSQVVTPTIDIGNFYQAETLDIARTDVTNQDPGIDPANPTAVVEVPTAEVWYVHAVHIAADNLLSPGTSGIVIRQYVDLARPTTDLADAFFLDPLYLQGDATVSQVDQLWKKQPLGIWLPSGSKIACQLVLWQPSASTTLSCAALIQRLKA